MWVRYKECDWKKERAGRLIHFYFERKIARQCMQAARASDEDKKQRSKCTYVRTVLLVSRVRMMHPGSPQPVSVVDAQATRHNKAIIKPYYSTVVQCITFSII